MTLGSAAAAHLTLIVWCKDCRHQSTRPGGDGCSVVYQNDDAVLEQAVPLLAVGSRNVDFVVSGTKHDPLSG